MPPLHSPACGRTVKHKASALQQLQQAARALGALMYAPCWRQAPGAKRACASTGAAGRRSASASAVAGAEASAAFTGSLSATRGPSAPDSAKAAHSVEAMEWWEASALAKSLVPSNADVKRRLEVYLLKASVQGLMESGEATGEQDQRVLADLLVRLDGPDHPPLKGLTGFGRLLAAARVDDPSEKAKAGAAEADLEGPWIRPLALPLHAHGPAQLCSHPATAGPPAPGRLLALTVTGLVIRLGWRVSAAGRDAVGAWWHACSRGLHGHVAFQVEILRPASVDACTRRFPPGALAQSWGDSDAKLWQVQHSTRIDWAAGKRDLMNAFCFECNLTDAQVGELGVEKCRLLVRVATIMESHHVHGAPTAQPTPGAGVEAAGQTPPPPSFPAIAIQVDLLHRLPASPAKGRPLAVDLQGWRRWSRAAR